MKVTFILPGIGKSEGEKYIKSWKVMEPLTIATLKALTPDDIEFEFFDDRLELINYDTKTDLVAIPVETFTARRAYAVSKKFMDRGVPVIMGGYHVMSIPEEAALHADSLMVGNAEMVWGDILKDAEKGKLKKRYNGKLGYTDSLPDRSIFKGRGYSMLGLIETGRGCPFYCEFCSIAHCYKSTYYARTPKQVAEDIRRSGKKYFFFIDDNVVANPKYTIELCKEITPLKIRWSGQGSLTMAKNKELLYWLRKSGCTNLLIGIESLEEDNLKQMKKEWSLKLGEREELLKTIHDAGITTYATFAFGFDFEKPDTFMKTARFAIDQGFYFAAFNHITPFPNTPLYHRLKKENRLLSEKWWLDPNFKYGDVAFQPKSMGPEELKERCTEARREFFKKSSTFKRWLKILKIDPNPMISLIFLMQNMNLEKEIDIRQVLPLGTGLDELPK
ncbi:MAG: radical SAM protein [bacterium]|nr:radical SAM protein [bacterium]